MSLHQTVLTEVTFIIRNLAEIDGKGHRNIENMRQSKNKILQVNSRYVAKFIGRSLE